MMTKSHMRRNSSVCYLEKPARQTETGNLLNNILHLSPRQLLYAMPLAVVMMASSAAQAQMVPTDAAGGCPIASATVAGMFTSGTVTLNGVAKPADSTLALAPNCGFFQWTEQMFLWLTSPAPAMYGGGSRIMFSPKFFTVTPQDASGRREFIVNNPRLPIRMLLRKTELGPHGLPAVVSRSGHVIEVLRPNPRRPVPPIVRLQSGAMVRLSSVERTPEGGTRFLDQRGAEVNVSRLALPHIVRPRIMMGPNESAAMIPAAAFHTAVQANKFILNKIPIFIDPAGNVIDVEPGQADDGVLLSQNGSLIYYITSVNDVYAYHRTMQGAAAIPFPTTLKFPMTTSDANAVTAFAATKGHTIVEPQALAIETKSSWIAASAVPNPNDYIQVTAVVPTFNKSNPNSWVPNGQATMKLVMVGLHVVGSTNGHGEMVWGTFEHQGNTPSAAYSYSSISGPKTVAQNTAGSWVFTPGGAAAPFNISHASWTGTAIAGVPVGAAIAPTSVLRTKPWGTDGSNSGLNTQVISANASVIGQLAAGDVRKQYFQIGTTWTIFGAPPSGGNEVGTNELANSTIETFMQASTPATPGSNCFSCHGTNTVSVSHVYSMLKPLP